MPAWNGWYHCMFNTYGTWLPGDGRGFRTRHHREHVEGDYKNPPPEGKYDKRHEAAKRRLKREPVLLTPPQRCVALCELRQSLQKQEIELLVISVSAMHVHLLARFPAPVRKHGPRTSAVDDPTRHFIGIAKRTAARRLLQDEQFGPAPVWAKRGKVKPVRDRAHQLRVFPYIREHVKEGAAVWAFCDEA